VSNDEEFTEFWFRKRSFGIRQQTHNDGCWRYHLECAVRRVEMLEKRVLPQPDTTSTSVLPRQDRRDPEDALDEARETYL
jgi:hypothetical protein